jgi:hypothetical protein
LLTYWLSAFSFALLIWTLEFSANRHPPICYYRIHPLMSFTSTLEFLTKKPSLTIPFIFENSEEFFLHKRSQSDFLEVLFLIAFLYIMDWLNQRFTISLLCSIFRFSQPLDGLFPIISKQFYFILYPLIGFAFQSFKL